MKDARVCWDGADQRQAGRQARGAGVDRPTPKSRSKSGARHHCGRIAALFALALTASAVEHSTPSPSRDDHRLHLGAGVAAGLVATAVVDAIDPDAPRWVRITAPIVAAAALGVAKEVYDAQHRDRHTPDTGDVIATAAGGVAVAVTLGWSF